MKLICQKRYKVQEGLNGYQLLDYISSNGTQWIDTGFTPNQNTSIELKMWCNGNVSQDFIGCGSSSYTFGIYNGGSIAWDNYGDDISMGLLITGTVIIKKLKNETTVTGDTSWSYMHSANTFTSDNTLYLFARNKTTAYRPATMKCYYCKIWDNGTLVRNFIPVRSKIQNKIGLYDTVNNVFYASDSGINFEAGTSVLTQAKVVQKRYVTNKLPSAYQEVKYLESFGNQYIDTGVKPTTTIGVEVKYRYTSVSSEGMVLGASSQRLYAGGQNYVLDTANNGFTFAYGVTTVINGGTRKLHIIYTAICNMNHNKSLYIDGTKIGTVSSTETLPDYNLFLFGRNIAGTYDAEASFVFKGRIYYCKIYDGTTLIRDYIPCIRCSDSKPGLYDLVNKTFTSNGNTSASVDFSYGETIDNSIKINRTYYYLSTN